MSTQSQQVELKVYARKGTGKSASFQTRAEGRVPAVVYGPKMKQPVSISLIPNELLLVNKVAGKTGIVTLMATDGAPTELQGVKVLLKELQTHPYKNRLTHVDLHAIDLSKKMRVMVPVQYVGKAIGTVEGGITNISTRQVEIRCAPDKIPAHLDIDVSALNLNESIHIEDVEKLFPELEFLYESNFSLVAVTEQREEAAAVAVVDPAAAAAAGAPGAAPAAGAAAAPAAAGAKAPAAAAKAPAAPAKK